MGDSVKMQLRLLVAFCAASVAAGDYTPVILNPSAGKTGAAKLILFVPGGKVPPSDYIPFLRASLDSAQCKVFGVIVKCGKLNLCDPLGQLDGLLEKALSAAAAANNNTKFEQHDIIVMGHSLGGVGARHYFDSFTKAGKSPFAGLALLGTQYNGDHEDFKGTLGYPTNLAAFLAPLLALTGELDMGPMSHPALLYTQIHQAPTNIASAQTSRYHTRDGPQSILLSVQRIRRHCA